MPPGIAQTSNILHYLIFKGQPHPRIISCNQLHGCMHLMHSKKLMSELPCVRVCMHACRVSFNFGVEVDVAASRNALHCLLTLKCILMTLSSGFWSVIEYILEWSTKTCSLSPLPPCPFPVGGVKFPPSHWMKPWHLCTCVWSWRVNCCKLHCIMVAIQNKDIACSLSNPDHRYY